MHQILSRLCPACSLFILIFAIQTSPSRAETPFAGKIQASVVAGRFYPEDAGELGRYVDSVSRPVDAKSIQGRVRALIVPHAGYEFSGTVAGSGYREFGKDIKRFIILAVNHNGRAPAFRAALPDAQFFETPLGRVRVSGSVEELLKNPLFARVPEAFASHVIEVQLPFLQRAFKDPEILPVVLGDASKEDIESISAAIAKLVDQETAIIVSSDLSHYHPYDIAKALDYACVNSIEAQNMEDTSRCEACGLHAILVLLNIAKERSWKSKIIEYKNSGDTSGMKAEVVGYSAIAFFEAAGLKEAASLQPVKAANQEDLSGVLLGLARQTLDDYVKTRKINPSKDMGDSRLSRPQGCFVTLKKHGELRGCIGNILPEQPLAKCIVENAVNAAVNDHRFSPVEPSELADIKVEVSLLSQPAALKRNSPAELLERLVPKKHGVILKHGMRSATYLPQVWEDLPDREKFLSTLCVKGRMQPDCWKDQTTEVLTYEAEVFAEK